MSFKNVPDHNKQTLQQDRVPPKLAHKIAWLRYNCVRTFAQLYKTFSDMEGWLEWQRKKKRKKLSCFSLHRLNIPWEGSLKTPPAPPTYSIPAIPVALGSVSEWWPQLKRANLLKMNYTKPPVFFNYMKNVSLAGFRLDFHHRHYAQGTGWFF